MNLNEAETPEEKKLTRKEKKALKRAERDAAKAEKRAAKEQDAGAHLIEEEEVEVMPASYLPSPEYSTWEKISPPAKRKKQLATMESGYREVLALVHSMRENQEVLMESFKKLPEAVDSVKQLADHSAQQSEILTAMNEQLESGSAGKFNETLSSMDKTTQLLLERAQRSEERLYSMLRRAQRRIAFMTLLVLLLFIGSAAAILLIAFPEQTQNWLEDRGLAEPEEVSVVAEEEPAPLKEIAEQLPVSPEMEDATLPLPEPVVLPEPEPLEALVPEENSEEIPPAPALEEDLMSIPPIAVPSEEELAGEPEATTEELEPLSTLQEDE